MNNLFWKRGAVIRMYTEAVNKIRCLLKNHPEGQPVPEDIIVEAANTLLKVGNLKDTPIEIIALCKNMGFKVYNQEMPDIFCGYIAIDGELKDTFGTDRIIVTNADESPKRRRFTVAHELGHYLFNFDPAKSISFYNAFEQDGETSPDENTCNRFAAELLMPKDIFTNAYELAREKFVGPDANYNIVQQLSEEFLVPPKAVKRRLVSELKLMKE